MLQQAGALRKYVLAIAGPQGWDITFDRFLQESPACGRVRRLGFVPLEDMPSLYHFASAFVYPSVYEGFGLPVLEALCSSAIVLTSNVSSLAEIAGNVVMTFNPYDILSIAEAVLKASTMERQSALAYRRSCRARGHQLLQESEDRPSMATLLTDRYTEQSCASPSLCPSSI
ncbi:MAG TPA: glycosyltransferase, partial [Acidobacteriota bacterium]|nr:glycosyltransferase [Acidobacteriota bacterium]